MPLPYSYKNSVEIAENKIKGKTVNSDQIIDLLVSELMKNESFEFEQTDNKITVTLNNSIVKFKYKVEFEVKQINDEFLIEYEYFLDSLIKISLISVIFTAFFSYFSVRTFLIFAGVFVFVFYTFNFLFINTFIKNIINKVIGVNEYDFEGSESLSENQKEWQKNQNQCPGCGSFVSEYDLNCPDCGLRVQQNRYTVPLDTTKYKDKSVKFHYKEKGKDSDKKRG